MAVPATSPTGAPGTPVARVIPLSERRATAPAPDCFAAVETYWGALCDGRLMPRRSDVDPARIAGALDRTFLLDRLAPGVVRFRLAGRHLADLMGMDVRGMPLTSFILPDARDAVAEAVEAVFAEPARVDLRLRTESRMLRRGASGRLLLLPLRDRRGEVSCAIGCLSADAMPHSRPIRFSVTDDDRRTLIGYAERRPAMGEDGAEVTPPPPMAAVRRAALRLVVNND